MPIEALLAQLSPDAIRKIGGTALEHDTAKLEMLTWVDPNEQAQVVQCHLSLGVPWESALEGRTKRSSEQTPEANQAEEQPDPHSSQSRTQRWPIDKLKPNRFNTALFPDSLSEHSIALIAEDQARNGQRVPVEVRRAASFWTVNAAGEAHCSWAGRKLRSSWTGSSRMTKSLIASSMPARLRDR